MYVELWFTLWTGLAGRWTGLSNTGSGGGGNGRSLLTGAGLNGGWYSFSASSLKRALWGCFKRGSSSLDVARKIFGSRMGGDCDGEMLGENRDGVDGDDGITFTKLMKHVIISLKMWVEKIWNESFIYRSSK